MTSTEAFSHVGDQPVSAQGASPAASSASSIVLAAGLAMETMAILGAGLACAAAMAVQAGQEPLQTISDLALVLALFPAVYLAVRSLGMILLSRPSARSEAVLISGLIALVWSSLTAGAVTGAVGADLKTIIPYGGAWLLASLSIVFVFHHQFYQPFLAISAPIRVPEELVLRNRILARRAGAINKILKTVADRMIALLCLALLAPLLLAAAIAIRLETAGPVFFRQSRHGLKNRIFSVFKFRSMTVMESGSNFRLATINDARITRVGRLLRRSSMDELPQLLNVLTGDMSLVGPRPFPTGLNDHYGQVFPAYNDRHFAVPGITGWAQINDLRGPINSEADMARRTVYDLRYVAHSTTLLDLAILAATPLACLTHKNAF